jgi:hypothetical protein
MAELAKMEGIVDRSANRIQPLARGLPRLLTTAAIANPEMAAVPTQIKKSLHRPATPKARPGINAASKSARRRPGRAEMVPRRFGSAAASRAMQAALNSAQTRPIQPSNIIRRTA